MAPSYSRYLLAAVAAVGASALFFAPAHANVEAEAVQSQPTASRQMSADRNRNRQVCKETRITGSRFQRTICRSAGDRAASEKDAEDSVRDFQINGAEAPPEVSLDRPK